MMLLNLPSAAMCTLPVLVWTCGVSGEAHYVERTAQESRHNLNRAYSLDDGRQQVQEALAEQFENCSQVGWDGYGAEPVILETCANAFRFIEALPVGFPMPTVGAEADGHLALDWYASPSRVVSVSISPEGDVHYAALLGGAARRSGTEAFLGDVPSDLLELIRRVALS